MRAVLLAVSASALVTLAAPASREATVVFPTQFEGGVDPQIQSKFASALRGGLDRGRFAVVPTTASLCADQACRSAVANENSASYILESKVSVVEYDYGFEARLYDGSSGALVASSSARCDLCGAAEALEAFGNLAASMRARVDALTVAAPMVSLRTHPPGATVVTDGTTMGQTPIDLTLAPGPHTIELTAPGYESQQLRITAVAGVVDRRTIDLVAGRKAPDPRPMLIGGGVVLGLGLAAMPAGAALIAVHGREQQRDCMPDIQGNCQFANDTLAGGIALLVSGAVATAIGATLVGVARRRMKRAGRGRVSYRASW